MGAPATLLESFAVAARDRRLRAAFHDDGSTCSWEALWNGARASAAALRGRGVAAGDRVVVVLPNGEQFVRAFLGIWLAGAVAVPLYPRSGAARVGDIARFCAARAVLTESGRRAALEAALPHAVILTVDATAEARVADLPPPAEPHTLAMLQFTSGSTGEPKGVELTHANLATNVAQLVEGLGLSANDIFVSWLPACHDMGLVLMTLAPLHLGAELHVLPANQHGLRRWMPTLAAARGTFTAAPDFAYRLVCGWARRGAQPRLADLRVALDAAEPVRASTLVDFEGIFGTGSVAVPGYGLAEATVGVTTGRPGVAPKVDGRGLVSVGRGLPGVELRIAASADAADGLGEIEVRTPAACRGYFANPRATEALFTADGYLRTGDLGRLDGDGELYIAGRVKNLLSWGGLSIAPQEIEETVDRLAFVRRSVVLGIDRGRVEGEQAYVFAEVAPRSGDLRGWTIAIVEAVEQRMGFRPARVYLLRPGAIPRTANGKVRHAALRDGYLAGELRTAGQVLFPDY